VLGGIYAKLVFALVQNQKWRCLVMQPVKENTGDFPNIGEATCEKADMSKQEEAMYRTV